MQRDAETRLGFTAWSCNARGARTENREMSLQRERERERERESAVETGMGGIAAWSLPVQIFRPLLIRL